ncbi:hypothetical protein [Streptomyces sp. NPDC090798]|uniref:hypothetical protein n=1 Tax=Streptomyces sp. NPDC090798 TaxID=3365968 RepID=UPI0038041831
MARSDNRDDTALGCAVLLGLLVVGAVCWLVWTAVMWVLAEWRWAWFAGFALAIPCLAYAIVHAWGEQRPFVPSRQLEAWATAVATSLAAAAPIIVLTKGWTTAVVALLIAVGSGSAVAYAPWWAGGFPKTFPVSDDDDALPAVAASPTE